VLSDSIQKGYSVSSVLSDYGAFLDTNYFPQVFGSESINTSNISDGDMEVFVGNDILYVDNYSNSRDYLVDSTGNSLNSIDLNLFIDGDLNSYVWSPDTSSGTIPVTIKLFSDHNYASFNSTIDPNGVTTLELYHSNDSLDLTLITIGATMGSNSSVLIDSNSINKVSFTGNFAYINHSSSVPITLNANLVTNSGNVFSNNLITISK
jgi:hypothetical protein